ncbi:hypothetical protein [Candidatus Berkiella aquae]|uniref:Extradiol ring-cleavage dioxygenase LigAB LigA subunit domain-containing protein n=1 Tax=Candidatus Berkiella aquae TaxID=295108 RepID=A0A0Q9YFM2_9GAMM|nr:hypothetical protein [Candidatus Berkiella aquae]MCS5709885.1 hypothetical protein [Candidatus Berkiella aquae]
MSAQSFELTLARLYTDQAFRQLFLAAPEKALAECDLSMDEKTQLMTIDKAGLIMAAHSFMHKRHKRKRSLKARLVNFILALFA